MKFNPDIPSSSRIINEVGVGDSQKSIMNICGRDWELISTEPIQECFICMSNIATHYNCEKNHGHYCRKCFWVTKEKCKLCPKCNRIFPSSVFVQDVSNIRFKCQQFFCDWIGSYNDLEQHIEICQPSLDFFAVPCESSTNNTSLSFRYYTLTFNQIDMGTMWINSEPRTSRKLWLDNNQKFDEVTEKLKDRNFIRFNLLGESENVQDNGIINQLMEFSRNQGQVQGNGVLVMCELAFYEPALFSDDVVVNDIFRTCYGKLHKVNLWHTNNINYVDEDNLSTDQSNIPQIVMFGRNFYDLLQKSFYEKRESIVFQCLNPFYCLNNCILVYSKTTIIPEINDKDQVVKLIVTVHPTRENFYAHHQVEIIPTSEGDLLGTLIFKVAGDPILIASLESISTSDNYKFIQQAENLPLREVEIFGGFNNLIPTKRINDITLNIISKEKSHYILDQGIAFEFPCNAFEKYPARLKISFLQFEIVSNYDGILGNMTDEHSFNITGSPSRKEIIIEIQLTKSCGEESRDLMFAIVHNNGKITKVKYDDANYKMQNSVCLKRKLDANQDIVVGYVKPFNIKRKLDNEQRDVCKSLRPNIKRKC